MSFSRKIIIFSILTYNCIFGTFINVELNLKCRAKLFWSYSFDIYEHDYATGNDLVEQNREWFDVEGDEVVWKSFEYSEGDGIWDKQYEFFFNLRHNCGNYTEKIAKSRFEEKHTRLYISHIPVDAVEFNTTISTFLDDFGQWKFRPNSNPKKPHRLNASDEE
ncbi:unnamed protein product [Caenorhabditis angaria]|uniref:Uncharacterized protein n=1 Tax=Caenorhabditis angaria TaxID=860376 RepID=A0A9P1INZ8_9PELO|nr:unnamed protein product [Caenorhabditis angaria]